VRRGEKSSPSHPVKGPLTPDLISEIPCKRFIFTSGHRLRGGGLTPESRESSATPDYVAKSLIGSGFWALPDDRASPEKVSPYPDKRARSPTGWKVDPGGR
jgi:hypothetical protein